MSGGKVFMVVLRRPTSRPGEDRADPFWEFGSFGCTFCHNSNLLNPRNAGILEGGRLVFAQGGEEGFRLVHLTPPIQIVAHKGESVCLECKWSPAHMPFKYGDAPLLIDNDGTTDFPSVKEAVDDVNRSTWLGRFSSRFRARTHPLENVVANELVKTFERWAAKAPASAVARCYEEALPYLPPRPDHHRRQSYQGLLKHIGGHPSSQACRKPLCRKVRESCSSKS